MILPSGDRQVLILPSPFKGIGQTHIQVNIREKQIILSDVDTVYGSFLNNKRLIPEKRYILHDKILTIGAYRIQICFKLSQQPNKNIDIKEEKEIEAIFTHDSEYIKLEKEKLRLEMKKEVIELEKENAKLKLQKENHQILNDAREEAKRIIEESQKEYESSSRILKEEMDLREEELSQKEKQFKQSEEAKRTQIEELTCQHNDLSEEYFSLTNKNDLIKKHMENEKIQIELDQIDLDQKRRTIAKEKSIIEKEYGHKQNEIFELEEKIRILKDEKDLFRSQNEKSQVLHKEKLTDIKIEEKKSREKINLIEREIQELTIKNKDALLEFNTNKDHIRQSKNELKSAKNEIKHMAKRARKEASRVVKNAILIAEGHKSEARITLKNSKHLENETLEQLQRLKLSSQESCDLKIEDAQKYAQENKEKADQYSLDKKFEADNQYRQKIQNSKDTINDLMNDCGLLEKTKLHLSQENLQTKQLASEEASKIISIAQENAKSIIETANHNQKSLEETYNQSQQEIMKTKLKEMEEKEVGIIKTAKQEAVKIKNQEHINKIEFARLREELIIKSDQEILNNKQIANSLLTNINTEKSNMEKQIKLERIKKTKELETQLDELKMNEVKAIEKNRLIENEKIINSIKKKQDLEKSRIQSNIKNISSNITNLIEQKLSVASRKEVLNILNEDILKNLVSRSFDLEDPIHNKKIEGYIPYNKDLAAITKNAYLKFASYAFVASLILGIIIKNPSIFSQIKEKTVNMITLDKSSTEEMIDQIEKKRKNKPIFNPKRDTRYYQSYTDKILYTKSYRESVISPNYKKAWTVAMNNFMTNKLFLKDNSIISFISIESKLKNTLLNSFKVINPIYKTKAIAKMRAAEKTQSIQLKKVFVNKENWKLFTKYEQDFFSKYTQSRMPSSL